MSKIANVALFNTVYEAMYKKAQAGNVPQSYLAMGKLLERAVDIGYVSLAPNGLVNRSSADAAITVRDTDLDLNRFSGNSPNSMIKNQGGLYLFRHSEAGLAEMMFYTENKPNNLPVNIDTRRVSVPHLLATKAIFRMYPRKPLLLANLSMYPPTGEVGKFIRDVESLPNVKNLLGGASLQSKMLDPTDYSVTRAIGLALGTSKHLNGLEAQTARHTDRAYQTGNNYCLFGNERNTVPDLRVDSVLLNFSPHALFDGNGKQIKIGDDAEALINGFVPNATHTEYTLEIEVDNGLKQGMKVGNG